MLVHWIPVTPSGPGRVWGNVHKRQRERRRESEGKRVQKQGWKEICIIHLRIATLIFVDGAQSRTFPSRRSPFDDVIT